MKKENLMKYVGSLQQVAYVRPMTYTEGQALFSLRPQTLHP